MEGGDLGPEPTEQINFITETKERETERARGLQGGSRTNRQSKKSGEEDIRGIQDRKEGVRPQHFLREIRKPTEKGARPLPLFRDG